MVEPSPALTRVLHVAFQVDASPGLVRQMQWENLSAQRLGISWHSELTNLASSVRRTRGGHISRARRLTESIRFYLGLWKKARFFDVVLLRSNSSNPLQLLGLGLLRWRATKVFLVLHSNEVAELSSRAGRRPFRPWSTRVVKRLSLFLCNGLVAVTSELLDNEKSTLLRRKFSAVYPNGIPARLEVPVDARGQGVEIAFVAGHFFPWNGLDLLLASVRSSSDDFILHLVGDLGPLASDPILDDPRIRCHGVLGAEELRRVLSRCHLGLSTFALYRKQMVQACPLKVREYLALGIPVAGDYEDIFPADFEYFKRAQPEINSLLRLARQFQKISRAEVAEASFPYVDKERLLANLYGMISYYAT